MPISRSNRKIIGISMGDPGGIGPEVTLKALQDPDVKKRVRQSGKRVFFVCIGSPEIYEENKRIIHSSCMFNVVSCLDESLLKEKKINILDVGDDATEVEVGKISPANAVLSYHALEVGAYCAREGVIDALVTASINKEAVQLVSPGFMGHTEYLARIAKVKRFAMMLQGGALRVVLVTTHIPLKDVSRAVTTQKVLEKIEIINEFLKRRVKIRKPTIGVASLNPHAGEGGKIGSEETQIIMPAITKAKKKFIRVKGPIPADVIFHNAIRGAYDAVVAMYHDQGLGPLKMLAFESGINITLNLPFVRTSPDHGTAFDIAYKNKAHHGSMVEAIKAAVEYC